MEKNKSASREVDTVPLYLAAGISTTQNRMGLCSIEMYVLQGFLTKFVCKGHNDMLTFKYA